jgi:hypothetical protein
MPETATTTTAAAAACRRAALACSPQVQLSEHAVSSIIVDVCLSFLLHSDAVHVARAPLLLQQVMLLLLLLLVMVVVLQLVLLLLVVAVQ